MENIIIHISDLHVTTFKYPDGSVNPKIESHLTTNLDNSKAVHFIDTFISKVKEDAQEKNYFLVITGDVADKAEVVEYEYAEKFIQKITDTLKISSDRILLLPGDHDVHRRSLENALDDNPNPESHLMNEVKFKNFSVFYKAVKKTTFPFGKVIIDHIIIGEKIVLIGINSNYKINVRGGQGFIPVQDFQDEIVNLKKTFESAELQFIACWHHNFTAGYENSNSGQWDTENRAHLLAELERQNIKLVLTGNEHTNNSKSVLEGNIWASDSGAFASCKHDATFNIHNVQIQQSIILDNRIYALQNPNGNDVPYFWDLRNNNAAKQPEKFELFIENRQIINEILDIPHEAEGEKIEEISELLDETDSIVYDNKIISDKLYSIIREKKLFHSGHFHWSETSRAHNWIDVSKLLEDNSTLYFVQNAIIDIIDTFKLAESCNLIIGLGYEGNIISSKASIKYNIPYTSLPYSYRYNDHHEYEKKLNYENSSNEFKTVIIITDVVNDGRTIRKLIDKREHIFFEKVEKVIVLSLFYTGHEEINIDILNYNKLPDDYDRENDHEVNNIEFFTIKSLRVEKCPYGKNYKEDCFIYKDDLSCVHLFYDESQAN
jgi:orotate phosphoribosyltransferase